MEQTHRYKDNMRGRNGDDKALTAEMCSGSDSSAHHTSHCKTIIVQLNDLCEVGDRVKQWADS